MRDHEGIGALRRVRTSGRRLVSVAPGLFPSAIELRLAQRSLDSHLGAIASSALVGALGPIVVLGALQSLGMVSLSVFVPLGLALIGFVAGPLIVHAALVERARDVHTDLRFQLSAYLDVVTMLLAGNSGHEGALEQAAQAGDGRLFIELRRRMREVGRDGQESRRGAENGRRRSRTRRAPTGCRYHRAVLGRRRPGRAARSPRSARPCARHSLPNRSRRPASGQAVSRRRSSGWRSSSWHSSSTPRSSFS